MTTCKPALSAEKFVACMETSATERRIVLQPSRECNTESRISAWFAALKRSRGGDLSAHRIMRDGAATSRNSQWIGAIADHAKGGRWRNGGHRLRQYCRLQTPPNWPFDPARSIKIA